MDGLSLICLKEVYLSVFVSTDSICGLFSKSFIYLFIHFMWLQSCFVLTLLPWWFFTSGPNASRK